MILKTLLALALIALARPAAALESAPVASDRLTATLVSDTDAVRPGVPMHLGLRLRMKPGWHTYWKNPGDAGAPPELTLMLPEGAKASGIAWPAPQRQPEGPLMTYGYATEVVLPVTVTPGDGPLDVQATATWLVCEKICVPEEGAFRMTLPQGEPAASAQAALLAGFLTRQPRPSPFEAHVAPDGGLLLSGRELSGATVRDAWFIPDDAGVIDQAAPQTVSVAAGSLRLGLAPGSLFRPGAALTGVVALRDPGRQDSYYHVEAAPGGAVFNPVPVWRTLLLAMLAGVILNLMPCVFPVLAMKAMALARLSGDRGREVRLHALSYVAGVLTAFGGLGGALLGLRAAGAAAGWGFQFQSPVLVVVMAWVLFAVGLNMSGVFEVGGRLAGTGQGLAAKQGHAGSFFTGLLAVLVATPCTAPFMGAVIAAALSGTTALAMTIFLAMGLGLAAPYAVLAAAPALARALPRPGRWMGVLRGGLAFPMYGAAAWLAWVVSMESGSNGLLAVLAGMVLLGFAAWCLGLAQVSGRRIGMVFAGAAVLGAALLLPGVADAPAPASGAAAEGTERFTVARLDALRAEGRPVFVNMTAAWCVTCLVNERVALSPQAVRQSFAAHRVAYLKGDWTRGDPAITAYLRDHERDGVPLYVLYPPAPAAPEVLPQILTEGDMLARLDKLGG
jgi:thiol:disulfide interchange protein/DsbC/DsbD-like thiol-disulfide interchange protein